VGKDDIQFIEDTLSKKENKHYILPDSLIVKPVQNQRALLLSDTTDLFSSPIYADSTLAAVIYLHSSNGKKYIYIDSQMGNWYKTGNCWVWRYGLEPIADGAVIDTSMIFERTGDTNQDAEHYSISQDYLNDYAEPRYDSVHLYSKPNLKSVLGVQSGDRFGYCIITIDKISGNWIRTKNGEWLRKEELNILQDSNSAYLHIGEYNPSAFCNLFFGSAYSYSDYIPFYIDTSLSTVKFISPATASISIIGKRRKDDLSNGPYGIHKLILMVEIVNDSSKLIGWMRAVDLVKRSSIPKAALDTIWMPYGFCWYEPSGSYSLLFKYWIKLIDKYLPIGYGWGTDLEFNCWFSPDSTHIIASGNLIDTTYKTVCLDRMGRIIFHTRVKIVKPTYSGNKIFLRGCDENDSVYQYDGESGKLLRMYSLPKQYYKHKIEVIDDNPDGYFEQWYPAVKVDSLHHQICIRYVRAVEHNIE
jgi:hypothetical protein